jgi:hypothetical protein
MPIASTIAAVVGAQVVGNIAQGLLQGGGASKASGQSVEGFQNASKAIDLNYGKAQNLLSNQYDIAQPYITSNYGNAIAGFAPYQQAGGIAANELGNLIKSGYASHQFNTQDLYNGLSPNYEFQLSQGQRAANQANNATGGMVGANAQQALQNYTQNFALGAYQNAFTNYQNQRNNIFGNIQPVANMGLDATKSVGNLYAGQGNALAGLATGYGQTGANLYANQGNAQGQLAIGSANAQAAGTQAQYDAYGNAIGGAGNNISNYMLLSSMLNKPTGGGGGGGAVVAPDGLNISNPVMLG